MGQARQCLILELNPPLVVLSHQRRFTSIGGQWCCDREREMATHPINAGKPQTGPSLRSGKPRCQAKTPDRRGQVALKPALAELLARGQQAALHPSIPRLGKHPRQTT